MTDKEQDNKVQVVVETTLKNGSTHLDERLRPKNLSPSDRARLTEQLDLIGARNFTGPVQ